MNFNRIAWSDPKAKVVRPQGHNLRFTSNSLYTNYGLYKVPITAGWTNVHALRWRTSESPALGGRKSHARFDEGGLAKDSMARLLRHRQTKGAETDRPILRKLESALYSTYASV